MGNPKIWEFPSRLGRIGSILFLIYSLLWVQWPIAFVEFNIVSVIVFVASVVTWASVELADAYNNPPERSHLIDDIKKLNTLLKIFDRKQFYTLRVKAIETYIPSDDYRGLENLIAYKENDIFPFHSEILQTKYNDFHDKAKEFVFELWQIYTSDGRGMSSWKGRDDRWVSDETFNKIQRKISVLNSKATILADKWEEIISFARGEYKSISDQIEHYEFKD